MSRTKKIAAPDVRGVKVPPPAAPPKRERKALVVFSEEEWGPIEKVAAAREEPPSTSIRVLAVAAALHVLESTKRGR